MNGFKLCKLLRRQPLKNRAGWKMAQVKSVKKSHSERKEPYIREAVTLSSKRSKTNKKNSWVDKDLTKSPKKKCFEANGAVQNAVKNRTTKNWIEEDLSKFPIKKRH